MINKASARNGVAHASSLDHLLTLNEELKVAVHLIRQAKAIVKLVFSDHNDRVASSNR